MSEPRNKNEKVWDQAYAAAFSAMTVHTIVIIPHVDPNRRIDDALSPPLSEERAKVAARIADAAVLAWEAELGRRASEGGGR